MPKFHCFRPTPSRQRGDMLVEAMIGMLLFAIAGMGITYITSNVAVSQREQKVQQQVVNEMRSMVQNRTESTDLCDGIARSTNNFNTSVSVSGCAATTATVSDGTTTVTIDNIYTPVVLSAEIEGIGEVRVGGVLDGN